MSTPRAPEPLLYSPYINDRAIVESLRMPPCPAGVDPSLWPAPPAGWSPGDDWPTGLNWCHDEVLFIRTHQAFEVWFALILHEVTAVVREALPFAAGVSPVDFSARAAAPLAPLGPEWSVTRRVIDAAASTDPALAVPLALLGLPGRLGQPPALQHRAGESDEFNNALVRWTRRLRRASAAMLCTLPFFDVLATMTPAEFLRFRDRLQPASGFGSVQFRELELLLGLREAHASKLRPAAGTTDPEQGRPAPPAPLLRPTDQTPGHERATSFYQAQPPWGWARVARRARETTLRDLVYALLSAAHSAASAQAGPEKGLPDMRPAAVDRFLAHALSRLIDDHYRGLPARRLDPAGVGQVHGAIAALDAALAHRETLAAAFIEMHPEQERFTQFLAAALDLDAALLRWRDRHIRFVEAIIGMRRGTGGGGIAYLRTTTAPPPPRGPEFTHAFPCLWQARSFVQNDDPAPPA